MLGGWFDVWGFVFVLWGPMLFGPVLDVGVHIVCGFFHNFTMLVGCKWSIVLVGLRWNESSTHLWVVEPGLLQV